jgi:hypothetical protein
MGGKGCKVSRCSALTGANAGSQSAAILYPLPLYYLNYSKVCIQGYGGQCKGAWQRRWLQIAQKGMHAELRQWLLAHGREAFSSPPIVTLDRGRLGHARQVVHQKLGFC